VDHRSRQASVQGSNSSTSSRTADAAAIQDETHVAYIVEDIEKALLGKSVLWPVTAFPTMKIAFVYDGGIPVEYVQMV
jgi:hypothetical protein